jgi:hypothetical protein
MKIKKYNSFIEGMVPGLAITDSDLPHLKRTKELSEEEFLQILNENCKNFSFNNDLLWRCREKKYDLELFEPASRKASPLAFPKFFNKIENDPNFPVIRKNSLIGGTDKEFIKYLVGDKNVYLVIPFDNSPIVFCPIVDLWALDDNRRKSSEKISGKDVSDENFVMVNYIEDFKIPIKELEKLPKSMTERGVEFFTSSPCLLLHESKMNWLKSQLTQ